jgi:hypothetical protein
MGAVSNEKEYSVTVIDDIVELEINGFVICKSIQLWHNLALREQVEQRAVESKDTEPMVTTDRFEQLAKQSSFNIYKSDLWQGTGERYSRMLVEECCQMMLDLESKYPANLAAREIKKHFGII